MPDAAIVFFFLVWGHECLSPVILVFPTVLSVDAVSFIRNYNLFVEREKQE